MDGNKHYITIDGQGRITGGWSDGPHPDRDTAGAVTLREDGGYQFRLFADGEENPCLTDEIGAHLWRYEGQVRESTAAELEAQRAQIMADWPPAPPTEAALIADLQGENKLLRAQVEALADRNDFQEELIVELAEIVYA